ncbi:MAG: rhodanese-like domain-containing protein [Candidatus Saccharimonadales bacterium]
MNRILIALGVIILAVGSIFYLTGGNITSKDLYKVSYSQIQENIDSGSPLIDVRTPEEYADSHAVGAINLPVEQIETGETPNVAKDRIVYLYCHSGRRAGEAKTILEKAGFTHVISITSLDNWISLGGKAT